MQLLMSPLSPYARKVRVLVREAGREAELEEVAVTTTALETDPVLAARNPLGRIPVLVRPDGPALVDSRVICRFLDARWGAGLYPERRLWEVLALEALAEGVIDSALLMSYEVRLRPAEARFAAWIEAQWAKVARTLDAIESRWTSHLAGPLDMGQVALAVALGYLDFRHGERGWREGRPALAAWEARLSARPSLSATRPQG
ncbi:glutathione S-transferase [Rubellimicrobium sp. CFH 75288]|uniref:glutathione S-transferase n=1 Tax=Rubellimicrobium sp. CFH 75288 TaxID=2697034 RepID=UPI0014126075|nr:glutathione S-transferase [Rubellimicrobium sp. CFH 75288]NAZ37323.1 glutathione S-transferase [Rubellimicrobium sp. CFH 75288]